MYDSAIRPEKLKKQNKSKNKERARALPLVGDDKDSQQASNTTSNGVAG